MPETEDGNLTRAILLGKLVRVASSDNSHVIVVRITDVEFVRFSALSDEDVEAEGINFDMTTTEKAQDARRGCAAASWYSSLYESVSCTRS